MNIYKTKRLNNTISTQINPACCQTFFQFSFQQLFSNFFLNFVLRVSNLFPNSTKKIYKINQECFSNPSIYSQVFRNFIPCVWFNRAALWRGVIFIQSDVITTDIQKSSSFLKIMTGKFRLEARLFLLSTSFEAQNPTFCS